MQARRQAAAFARKRRLSQRGKWLRADATSNPVQDATRVRGRVHKGHLWAWGNYETVLFAYTPDKTAVTLASLFPGFKGTVLIDGASDFNLLEQADGVVRAGCWAHARRHFYEAMKYDRRLAPRGLYAIRELFMAKHIVMARPIEERVEIRENLCAPVLTGIRQWVAEELPGQIPKTPGHAALQYLENQWERLSVFLRSRGVRVARRDPGDRRQLLRAARKWPARESLRRSDRRQLSAVHGTQRRLSILHRRSLSRCHVTS